MWGRDMCLLIGFIAQRRKRRGKKKGQGKERNEVGLGSKWGKERVWDVWMM